MYCQRRCRLIQYKNPDISRNGTDYFHKLSLRGAQIFYQRISFDVYAVSVHYLLAFFFDRSSVKQALVIYLHTDKYIFGNRKRRNQIKLLVYCYDPMLDRIIGGQQRKIGSVKDEFTAVRGYCTRNTFY